MSLILSGGIALAVIGGLGLLLFDDPEPGGLGGVSLGGAATIFMAAIAILPQRRMPDWAIGVRGDRLSRNVNAVPLVALGWAFAAAAGVGALIETDPVEAAYAVLIAAIAPVALARSLQGFLESARGFRAWAGARGLAYAPEVDPPDATPLLRRGTYRYAINCVRGEIAARAGGLLCQLGVVTIDDDGQEVTSASARRYTILAVPVPDVGERLPVLVCAPRSRVPGYDAIAAMERKLERIDLESSDFESRWDLAIEKGGDQSWLRRLFEPTFTELLSLSDPGWGWEVQAGMLVVYESGWRRSSADLDRVVDRAEPIVARLVDEAGHTSRPA